MIAVIATNSVGQLVFAGLNIDEESEKDNNREAGKLFAKGFEVKRIPAEALSNYKWDITRDEP